jgi:predicted homoserine dehydrogenase-like protein
MHMEKIRIVVIGAGETGTPLLRQLLAAAFVEVVGVADLDDKMPGIQLARQHGIQTTNDFMTLARLGAGVDIIIDVTGVAKVRDQLRSYMQESGNHHTIIMHELIAVLLMSLSQGKLVSMKHNTVHYD